MIGLDEVQGKKSTPVFWDDWKQKAEKYCKTGAGQNL